MFIKFLLGIQTNQTAFKCSNQFNIRRCEKLDELNDIVSTRNLAYSLKTAVSDVIAL